VFFSSHVLSEVERVCDRVAIVRAGRVVEVDDVAALLGRQRRRASMRLGGSAPSLDGVPGVSEVIVSAGRLDRALEGDPRPFLAAIAGAEVLDLVIEPARLEDAFLELYEGEAAAEAGADAASGRVGRRAR
jgi:ABC-2 type transport system ATP-binding protein